MERHGPRARGVRGRAAAGVQHLHLLRAGRDIGRHRDRYGALFPKRRDLRFGAFDVRRVPDPVRRLPYAAVRGHGQERDRQSDTGTLKGGGHVLQDQILLPRGGRHGGQRRPLRHLQLEKPADLRGIHPEQQDTRLCPGGGRHEHFLRPGRGQPGAGGIHARQAQLYRKKGGGVRYVFRGGERGRKRERDGKRYRKRRRRVGQYVQFHPAPNGAFPLDGPGGRFSRYLHTHHVSGGGRHRIRGACKYRAKAGKGTARALPVPEFHGHGGGVLLFRRVRAEPLRPFRGAFSHFGHGGGRGQLRFRHDPSFRRGHIWRGGRPDRDRGADPGRDAALDAHGHGQLRRDGQHFWHALRHPLEPAVPCGHRAGKVLFGGGHGRKPRVLPGRRGHGHKAVPHGRRIPRERAERLDAGDVRHGRHGHLHPHAAYGRGRRRDKPCKGPGRLRRAALRLQRLGGHADACGQLRLLGV